MQECKGNEFSCQYHGKNPVFINTIPAELAKILIPMLMREVLHAHDPCPALCSSLFH
jgi:hypothetical protein